MIERVSPRGILNSSPGDRRGSALYSDKGCIYVRIATMK